MKSIYTILLFLIVPLTVRAQYATLGTGVIRDHIWWFDWNNTPIVNGTTKTFTTTDGTVYTVRLSNISGLLEPNVMNTWYGAVLHNLYDFSDPNVKPALHSKASSQTVRVTLTVSAVKNGMPVGFTFIGADAEASATGEVCTLTTDGPTWSCLELFKNSTQNINPVTGCGTNRIEITQTYGGSANLGQNPLMGAHTATGSIQVDVTLERRGGQVGGQAVAFGVYAPYDRGDLISGYGTAQHELKFSIVNGCAYPAFPSLQQQSSIYIGSVPGDADGITGLNDNANGVDEEGVPVFSDYNGSTGIYTLPVNVTNTSGANAYLCGWFDFNKNGQFDANELQTAVVAPNQTSVTFIWTGLPYDLPQGFQPSFGFRFRISSDQASVQSPTGLSPDGEVEDYLVPLVQVCQITKVNAGADQTVCLGETAQLQATGGLTYTWNASPELSATNISNPVATPVTTREYILSATHGNGCRSKDSVVVTVIQRPTFTAPSGTEICAGDQITFTASGATRIDWLDANDNLLGSGINYILTPPASTLLRVAFELTQCNLHDTADIAITVHPIPATTILKSNDVTCQTGRATLTAYGGTKYQWEMGPGITDPSQAIQSATPTTTQKYFVLVTDRYGCSALDSVEVTVDAGTGLAGYHMPNAFSPNGDGQNDCFGIRLPGMVNKFNMTIYDRWGNVMFHTNNINDCWDGTYKGVPLDIATFVYVIQIESLCGAVERRGTVTLIR